MFSSFVYRNLNPFLAKNLKFVVKRRSESLQWQRKILLEKFLDLAIVDIGANLGQFVREVRSYGFKGFVYSIEPHLESYSNLVKLESKDDKLRTYRLLILERNGIHNLYSFSRSDLNSIYLPAKDDQFQVGEKIDNEMIESRTLDSFLEAEVSQRESFVKIDTQGSELKVLEGLKSKIPCVRALQVETSIKSIYENPTSLKSTLEWIFDNGFQTTSIVTERFDELFGLAYDIDILAVNARS